MLSRGSGFDNQFNGGQYNGGGGSGGRFSKGGNFGGRGGGRGGNNFNQQSYGGYMNNMRFVSSSYFVVPRKSQFVKVVTIHMVVDIGVPHMLLLLLLHQFTAIQRLQ